MLLHRLFCGALVLAVAGVTASAQPFLYQGRLDEGGQAATGTYDMRFTLFSTSNQVGGVWDTTVVEDISVIGGLFSALIEFPKGMNTGFRWLEIQVRPGDSTGAYTLLTPRQFLAAAPFAAIELNDPWQETVLGAPPLGSTTLSFGDGLDRVLINRSSTITPNEFFGIRTPTTDLGGMYIDAAAGGEPFYGYAVGGTSKAYHYYNGADDTLRLWRGAEVLTVSQAQTTVSNDLLANARLTSIGRLLVGTGIPSFLSADPGTNQINIGGVFFGTRREVNVNIVGEVTAETVAATDFAYVAPRTRVLSLSHRAFALDNDVQGFDLVRGFDFNVGGSYTTVRDGATALSAPLNLPDGAVITNLTAYFLDAAQSSNLAFRIYRQSHNDGSEFPIGSILSSGSSFFYRTQGQNLALLISNSTQSYFIEVVPVSSWSEALRLRSIKIEYTVSGPD